MSLAVTEKFSLIGVIFQRRFNHEGGFIVNVRSRQSARIGREVQDDFRITETFPGRHFQEGGLKDFWKLHLYFS